MSSSCVPTGLPFSTWPRPCPRCARTLRACCPWTRPFSVCRHSTRLCSTSCLCRGPLVASRVQREVRQLSQLPPHSGLLALPPGAKGNVRVVHRHVPQEGALPPPHRCLPKDSQSQSYTKAPAALQGMHSKTPEGRRICWAFNLAKGCPNGDDCPRGLHVCVMPGCYQKHSLCQHPGR